MNNNDLEKFELYLKDQVSSFLANGGKLVKNNYGLSASERCPMGILSVNYSEYFSRFPWYDYNKTLSKHIFNILGINLTEDFIISFTVGFDNKPFDPNYHDDEEGFYMGKRFRFIFLNDKY